MKTKNVALILGILFVLVIVIASCASNKPAAQVAPAAVVENPVPPAAAAPSEPPVVEEVKPLIELGTGEIVAIGLKDENATPKVTLKPGEGLLVSSDKGEMVIQGTSFKSESGFMAYAFNENDSGQTIEVSLITGWNKDNERFNVNPVKYQVNKLDALRELVLKINVSEVKPAVFGYIFGKDGVITDPALK
jgi:hypothetical protein